MKLKGKTHKAYKKDPDSLTQELNLKSVPKIHAGSAVYLYKRGSSWDSHWGSMGTVGRSVIFSSDKDAVFVKRKLGYVSYCCIESSGLT